MPEKGTTSHLAALIPLVLVAALALGILLPILTLALVSNQNEAAADDCTTSSTLPALTSSGSGSTTRYVPGDGSPGNPSVLAISYEVATSKRASDRATDALFMALWVESGARNLANHRVPASFNHPHDPYGTRDAGSDGYSIGTLQQQSIYPDAWGTVDQIMDPAHAAARFLDVAADLESDGFSGTAGELAQAVQRSAHPDRYDGAARIAERLQARAARLAQSPTMPTAIPAAAPPAATTWVEPIPGAAITSHFGNRPSMGDFHTGADWDAETGTPVHAIAAGTVESIQVFRDAAGNYISYGRLLTIDHGNGIQSRYAHLSRIDTAPAATVTAGQIVSAAGDVGRSTGAHLHMEILVNGQPVDPVAFLEARKAGEPTGQGTTQNALYQPCPETTTNGTTYTVASMNVLGSSHTRPGGKKAARPSGPERMTGAVQTLTRHNISIVGLQEFEPDQWRAFKRHAGHEWDVWFPGKATRNAIAWKQADWRLVKPHSITIPYFYGNPVPMPYVQLQSTTTGETIWVGNFHNPADTHRGNMGKWRAIAADRQARLADRLAATGNPVLILGDMNERRSYACKMTASGAMHAAAGGGTGTPCRPPAWNGIDWIFGSTNITFTNWTVDRSPLVQWTTDHPVVLAQATIGGTTAIAGAAAPYPGGPTGCTQDDPTTDRCITATTEWMLQETNKAFPNWPDGIGCWGTRDNPTYHDDGRACDFMVGTLGNEPKGETKQRGDALAQWLVSNAAPLRVIEIIWYNEIWTPAQGWRPYGKSGATQGHYDHVHVSLDE